MPMGVNGIQTPSGEQPEHLENVICADMKVLGAIVVKNDQKATSLYSTGALPYDQIFTTMAPTG